MSTNTNIFHTLVKSSLLLQNHKPVQNSAQADNSEPYPVSWTSPRGGSPRHSETSHAGKLRFFSGDKRKQLLNHQLVCAVQRLKQIHLIYHTHVWFTTLNYSSAQDTLTLASFIDLPVSSQIICWSPDDWIDAAGAAVYVCCQTTTNE